MGAHLIDGEFQSDKYPSCPRGKVPLSTKDPDAQDLLWTYAQRHRRRDPEFADDLMAALEKDGFNPSSVAIMRSDEPVIEALLEALRRIIRERDRLLAETGGERWK